MHFLLHLHNRLGLLHFTEWGGHRGYWGRGCCYLADTDSLMVKAFASDEVMIAHAQALGGTFVHVNVCVSVFS